VPSAVDARNHSGTTSSDLEFVVRTRDELERLLSTPVQGRIVATGQRTTSPPVNSRFHLDSVEIESSWDPAHVVVKFRWDGESDLFAVSYPVDADDDDFNWGDGPAGFAMSIKVALEEDLCSVGYTLDHALREPSDGVVWVRWDGPKGFRVRFDR
jgi:hypothetical protein